MPRGPNGGRRTADVVGCAVQVARISGGDVDELRPAESAADRPVELHEKSPCLPSGDTK